MKQYFETFGMFFLLIILFLFVYWIYQNKKTPSYHVVVAKYKEDVTWLFHMDLSKLYVYDKSGDPHSPFCCLENKGREGSTFLGHIIEHYHNLPDYLVLVQGNPFPHMRQEITPCNFQENLYKLISKRPIQTEPLFCDSLDEPIHLYSGLILDRYMELMFEMEPKKSVVYAPGNQYVIPRNIILKRPQSFYQKLWHMSIKGSRHENGVAHFGKNRLDPTEIFGWSLERLFFTILSDVPIQKSFLENP